MRYFYYFLLQYLGPVGERRIDRSGYPRGGRREIREAEKARGTKTGSRDVQRRNSIAYKSMYWYVDNVIVQNKQI